MGTGLREAGAVKYALDDVIPGHLHRVAMIEINENDPVPPHMVQYDLTYYDTPDEIPPSVLALAAHPFALGAAIPDFIRKIVAWVLALVTITDGKSLKFNVIDNSGHITTVGL